MGDGGATVGDCEIGGDAVTNETTHVIAKLERMLAPVEVKVNGNVIEQMPALIGPIKRKDLEILMEAARCNQNSCQKICQD